MFSVTTTKTRTAALASQQLLHGTWEFEELNISDGGEENMLIIGFSRCFGEYQGCTCRYILVTIGSVS